MCIRKATSLSKLHKRANEVNHMGKTQLFVYYRIPKPEIETGLRCATALMADLAIDGLAQGQLYQREEEGKPYYTLMEVITPVEGQDIDTVEFTTRFNQLVAQHFSALAGLPQRHVELFKPVKVL